MMTLKYPCPRTGGNAQNQGSTVFTLPPQGEPWISAMTQASLHRLSGHIRQRLTGMATVTCHPHRVGVSHCVAITMEGKQRQTVNILITVSGQESWPDEEDYRHPRWYIGVTDTADLLYLVLWLNGIATTGDRCC